MLWAICRSVLGKSLMLSGIENPAPNGLSIKIKFTLEFQLNLLVLSFRLFSSIRNGPFSRNNAISEEHPGPPVSHSAHGSVSGLPRLGNYQ